MGQGNWISRSFKGDRVVWGLVVLFMIYGLLAVYSSSVSVAYKNYGGNTTYFLSRQFFMLVLSLVIIYLVHKLPYRIYSSLAGLFMLISVGLLIITIFFGVTINGATRWLEILGVSVQTSDIAKLALVIYLARALSHYQNELKDLHIVTVYLFMPIALICALIVKDNLSTAGMIFLVSLIIMFIGRVPFRYLLLFFFGAIIGLFAIVAVLDMATKENRIATWKGRIENFVGGGDDLDGDYQSNQAKIAIATGGLVGKAPGKSTQRNILPQSNSDYIFAIIIEEYGLLFGAIPLVLAYMILMFRGIAIAKKCETAFPAFLVIGLSVMIVTQALLNMLVAVGLFPVTGQTLPMVSWGRTSVLVMSVAFGAILSVSRVNNARAMREELEGEEKDEEV
ncbi:MAG TPA: FtsW/RodA/SpoVE family cell cycle protein [Bacteroidetes bacterium]|nr:FtsW/RodA/SpoVE family cell cycle protein [Bacteroidota bacterium]